MNSFKEISQILTKNNLSLTATISNVAKCLELIELHAFQKDSKLIFALKIQLVESETLPLSIRDKRISVFLYHAIIQKYAQKYPRYQ